MCLDFDVVALFLRQTICTSFNLLFRSALNIHISLPQYNVYSSMVFLKCFLVCFDIFLLSPEVIKILNYLFDFLSFIVYFGSFQYIPDIKHLKKIPLLCTRNDSEQDITDNSIFAQNTIPNHFGCKIKDRVAYVFPFETMCS